MITVKQNGKPRVVTANGKIICRFDESGIAAADEAYMLDLVSMGYIVNTSEEADNGNTSGKADGKTAAGKRSKDSGASGNSGGDN